MFIPDLSKNHSNNIKIFARKRRNKICLLAEKQTKATSCSWLILVLTDNFEKTDTRLFGKVSAGISVLTRIL